MHLALASTPAILICVPGVAMRTEALELQLPESEQGLVPGSCRYDFSDTGPKILVTAGIHGNEVNAIGAVWCLREQLQKASLHGSVTVIPCVNPLATMGKTRRIPGEDTDLNRFFPGHDSGYLAERLAAQLAQLLQNHDALIDVHTTGWCAPHVLIDGGQDAGLARHLRHWAAASELPVVLEMVDELAGLQGLERTWSGYAVAQGKAALTIELPGFLTFSRREAQKGAGAILKLVAAAQPTGRQRRPNELWQRTELHTSGTGLFEAHREPGERLSRRDVLGVVRNLAGEVKEEVRAPRDGLLLVLQTGSAVTTGSWLATMGCLVERDD